MLNKDQHQRVGPGGVAIQAGGDVVMGVSVADALQIAKDMARITFYELSGKAKDTLDSRVDEITNKVISRLEKEYPQGLSRFVDPDFQYALLTVQRQYGRTGDKELGDLLVDLLVDRSKHSERDILQIVLSESLEVAPKLTSSQIANISIIFLFRYNQNFELFDYKKLGEYFDRYVKPLVNELITNKAAFQHLEFTGCGIGKPDSVTLEDVIVNTYPVLFSIGLDAHVIDHENFSAEISDVFIMPCLHNGKLFQASAANDVVLAEMFEAYGVSDVVREKIIRVYKAARMSNEQVRKMCVRLRPYMSDVFSVWGESDMKGFSLTSVGMSIAHANIKRIVGSDFYDLSRWIN